jgi:hypothetical protein
VTKSEFKGCEQRDRGSYGLLVSRTALAHANPKYWSLPFAINELYKAFEAELQKPGKMLHELVRHRRRELGLPLPPEARILPFRSQASCSLPAIDLVIDGESDDISQVPHSSLASNLNILRTERRLEELDLAVREAEQQHLPLAVRNRLIDAFEQELQNYEVGLGKFSKDC